jgi:ABC-type cobalamin transport system permease subunit
MSMGNQRRWIISASAVVASFFESRILIRFARRERRAGFTSFRVT